MPWWSVLCLFFFVAGVLVGSYEGLRKGNEKPIVIILDLVTMALISYLFISFWIVSWRGCLGFLAPYFYIATVGWQLFTFPQDIREAIAEPTFSDNQKGLLFTAISLLITVILLFAGLAAFK